MTMKNMNRWITGTGLLALALLTQQVVTRSSAVPANDGRSSLITTSPVTKSVAQQASKEREEEVVQVLSHYAGEAGRRSATQLEAIGAVYNKLYSLHDFFDRSRIEDVAFERMASDPAAVDLNKRILADGRFTTSAFGSDQAIARVYATKFLTYLARKGDSTPLLETIANLSESMEEHGEQVKAQSEDLLSLVRSYAAFVDKERANQEPETIFAALGLQGEDLSTPNAALVSHAVFNGLALGLNGKVPYDHLTALLVKRFPKIAKGA